MKKIKEMIINFFNGLLMALADSVPGVSGGTVAFILGFYDKFIASLDDLFRGNIEKKKKALVYLIKIGIGWVIGFLLAASVLSSLFHKEIYKLSSLFLGFIIFAIPIVIKTEKKEIKGKYKHILFFIIVLIVVIGITLLNTTGGLNISINNLNIVTIIYIFLSGALAISAMILPGISGSTILLIFGLYIPIMNKIKDLIHLDFNALPVLIIFGLGIIFGVVIFAKTLRKCLEHHRSSTIYLVLGLMLGSVYPIIMGPTTLESPMEMLNFKNFSILYFIIGGIIIIGLEYLKKIIDKKD